MEPPGESRSRLRNTLVGCAVGCAVLTVVLVSSCVSIVWWVNRPGELLEPSRLRGPDTAAYAEWTLRLEDPGTAAIVRETLGAMSDLNRRTGLPPPVGGFLSRFQDRRNEKKLHEMFPMVVAWSLLAKSDSDDELHLFAVSVEKLGNRLVLTDWILGWILGRDADSEVVDYRGERIYFLPEQGAAFFLRRAQFFFTTGLDAARSAVDRLEEGAAAASDATTIDRLLGSLPAHRPLRGATNNENGEVERLLALLLDAGKASALDGVPWDEVRGATLSGGFEESSDFAAELTLLTERAAEAYPPVQELAGALSASLGTESTPVRVTAAPSADGVVLRFEIEDLPRLLDSLMELIPDPTTVR